jgi:hypothetical protein
VAWVARVARVAEVEVEVELEVVWTPRQHPPLAALPPL